MLIDPFKEPCLAQLEARLPNLPVETNMFLLIDGVFVPGLFRSREFQDCRNDAMALLFEALPGCSAETKDVSPFLVRVDRWTQSLRRGLGRCSGWPMVSAIETTESLSELSSRLAAWCVVEADGQRFNFRFPDTRRLPAIFKTLTVAQRAGLAGPASRWSYVTRDGRWEDLNVEAIRSELTSQPELDDSQFAALVGDSEPEEILLQLAYRDVEPAGLPSVHYGTVCRALRIADEGALAQELRCDWCAFVLNQERQLGEVDAAACFADWRIENERRRDEN